MSKAVQQMFHSIARRYDVANDVLSLGIHRLWRRTAVKLIDPTIHSAALDLCCGTGDMTFAIANKLNHGSQVVGLDFVHPMLTLAESKQRKRDLDPPVLFMQGDALHLPFQNQSFDLITIAFGIRNVDDVPRALAEMRRVLRPGGRVIILEFGQPTIPGLSLLYRLYSRYLMPVLGSLVTHNRAAYEYLPETARRFPAGERFASWMKDCGITDVRATSLFGGIAFIYTGLVASAPAFIQSSYAETEALCHNSH